jgi:hypothetical protein
MLAWYDSWYSWFLLTTKLRFISYLVIFLDAGQAPRQITGESYPCRPGTIPVFGHLKPDEKDCKRSGGGGLFMLVTTLLPLQHVSDIGGVQDPPRALGRSASAQTPV